jgi:hypothetical protein
MDIALCASVAKHVTYNRHVESLSIILLNVKQVELVVPGGRGQ